MTEALVELLDQGGVSLAGAARRLGLSEGQALVLLARVGRSTRVEGDRALAAVRAWGRIRVILRSGGSVAEVMSDLSAVRQAGGWWNDEDDRVHLHLDVREVQAAFLTTKAGHARGRTVRMLAFVDAADNVLFKVMLPKERADLVAPFIALRESA